MYYKGTSFTNTYPELPLKDALQTIAFHIHQQFVKYGGGRLNYFFDFNFNFNYNINTKKVIHNAIGLLLPIKYPILFQPKSWGRGKKIALRALAHANEVHAKRTIFIGFYFIYSCKTNYLNI